MAEPADHPRVRPEPRGPLLSPGFWLHHAALAWRQELDVRLRPLGLTHTQFNLLASTSWLQHTQGAPTQQQVADQAGADRMMASKVLTTLENRGLLIRRPHGRDTRAKVLQVTPEGTETVRRAVRIVAEIDHDFFGDDGTARATLRERLRTVAEHRRPS